MREDQIARWRFAWIHASLDGQAEVHVFVVQIEGMKNRPEGSDNQGRQAQRADERAPR